MTAALPVAIALRFVVGQTAAHSTSGTFFVQVSSANIRARPEAEAELIARVAIGTECVLEAEANEWAEATCSGWKGFLKRELLDQSKPSPSQLSAEANDAAQPPPKRLLAAERWAALSKRQGEEASEDEPSKSSRSSLDIYWEAFVQAELAGASGTAQTSSQQVCDPNGRRGSGRCYGDSAPSDCECLARALLPSSEASRPFDTLVDLREGLFVAIQVFAHDDVKTLRGKYSKENGAMGVSIERTSRFSPPAALADVLGLGNGRSAYDAQLATTSRSYRLKAREAKALKPYLGDWMPPDLRCEQRDGTEDSSQQPVLSIEMKDGRATIGQSEYGTSDYRSPRYTYPIESVSTADGGVRVIVMRSVPVYLSLSTEQIGNRDRPAVELRKAAPDILWPREVERWVPSRFVRRRHCP